MTYMDYAQIEVRNNGYADTSYVTCGHSSCNEKILKAMGVGDERFRDDTFDLSDDENEVIVTVRHEMDEQDACTWCYGCGDFLVHGISCTCAEQGHDPDKDRESMRPMVDVNGFLELRPY
jgi:hypothetical protein